MRRTTAMTVAASSLVAGLAGLAVATPANADTPAPSPAPVVPAEKTIAQVATGKAKLRKGDTGAAVLEVQKRLTVIGLPTATTGTFNQKTKKQVAWFQEKFFLRSNGNGVLNQKTWRKLNALSADGDRVPAQCKRAKVKQIICADKTHKVLRYFEKGKLVMVTDARFGMPGEFHTRNGTWKVYNKIPHGTSTEYGAYMPWALYFSGGQAVHDSSHFRAVGYGSGPHVGSHGCINIADTKKVRWLYKRVSHGATVIVYAS